MWFDIIKSGNKSRKAHSKLILKEMRRIIRPHIRELIDSVMENRDYISVAEIKNIIENNKETNLQVFDNEEFKNLLAKYNSKLKSYFNAWDFQESLSKMATAKLSEDGYTKENTSVNNIRGIYYFKPENNRSE